MCPTNGWCPTIMTQQDSHRLPKRQVYHDFQNNGFPVKYWRRSRFIFFSFILRFWNQIFTCRSVRLSILDNCRRFSLFMYTLKKNSRSSSRIWYFVYGHLFFLDFVAPTKRNATWLHCNEFELYNGRCFCRWLWKLEYIRHFGY